MISIFYRQGAEIIVSQHETEFAKLSKSNVLWIDLLSPNGDEKRATEAFLGTEIQSRATAEEIESSSRFSENDIAIFANTNFLSPADDEMAIDPVSFTLVGDVLTTVMMIGSALVVAAVLITNLPEKKKDVPQAVHPDESGHSSDQSSVQSGDQ